jgi:CheY-like chemotaxis protein
MSEQRSSSDRAAGGGLKILVVDDHQDSAELLATILEIEGHLTRIAYDGQSAIAYAIEFRPDAILLDIGLPDMNGYELARRLREEESVADSRMIAVTGYSRDEDKQRAAAAGFDHHLVKPVDPDELRRVLASVHRSKEKITGQD